MKKILLAAAVIGAFAFGAKAATTDAWEFTLDAKGDMSISASIDDYTQPNEGSSKQNRIVYAASFSGDAPTYTTVTRMVDGKEMAFAENLLPCSC